MKKKIALVIFGLCILLLASCQTTITTTTASTTSTTSTYPVSTTSPKIIDSLLIEFDSLTTEEENRQFKLDFEEILQTLHQDGFDFPLDKPIYVQLSPYQYNRFIDNSLNLYKNSVKSLSTLENIFFAIYGNFANYGLVYGLSRYYAQKLDIQTEPLSSLSIRDDINEMNQHLLQVWYVGFIEPYSTPEEMILSKQISVQLVNYLIEIHGFEYIQTLLSKTDDLVQFDTAFTEIRNQWLIHTGSSLQVEPRNVPLAFGYELHWYKVIWSSPRATWFLYSDYEDFFKDYIDDSYMFMSSQQDLVYLITNLEIQMAEMDLIFKNPNLNPKLQYTDLSIYLRKGDNNSNFSTNMHVDSLSAFIHEYVHYLTIYWLENYTWLIEGVPMYYTRTYGYEGELIKKLITPSMIAPFQEYLGREFVFESDFHDWGDYLIYTFDDYDKTTGTHPIQGVSFIRYFIKVYGEDTFFLFARKISNAFDLTGKTYEELVVDWIQDVKNSFSDLN